MDMSGTSNMTSASTMMMTFFTAIDTPLFSMDWTPTTTAGYAGTCIFIIILAIISRCISVYRSKLEKSWLRRTRSIVIAGANGETDRLTKKGSADSNDSAQIDRAVSRDGVPFRLSVDVPRAALYTVQAGIGYLLMIAVMTMNVGYFLSVLGGLFLGELVLGRYSSPMGRY